MGMWYYTKDRKSRVGPVSDEELRELIAARKVEAADLVWREGFQTWLPVEQVPGLAPPPPPAPVKPPSVPIILAQPTPAAPKPATVPVQVIGPIRAELLPEDEPVEVNPVAAAPVVSVPVSVTPLAATPAPVAPTAPVAAPQQPPSEVKKVAAPVAPARAQPAPAPVPMVPVQLLPVELVKDDISARDTGDFEPEQFTRCREYLREAGIAPADLVFFCNTRNRAQVENPGVFNIIGSSSQSKAVLHLALTKREVALVYEGEGKKIVIDRAPHEAVAWKFAGAAEAAKPSALATAASLFKREQAPPERIEVLKLGLPSGEHELRLTPGEGLMNLKKRAAQVFQELARANLADGKCYYADRLLRQIEPTLIAATDLESLQQQIGVVAEVAAHYQGGHPQFLDGTRGVLRLDALGLEFVPANSGRGYVRIRYDHILDIMEPQKGDFPEEIIKSAEMKKSAARAVGLVAGFAGAAMKATDTEGAGLVTGVGKTVAGSLNDGAALGAPPKNRLCTVLSLDGVKHRVLFDVVAATTPEMEQQAKAFWNRTAAVRARFARPGAPKAAATETPPTGGSTGHLAALRELKELLDQGVLTQEEFAQQKAALLGQTRGGGNVQPRVVGCPRCQSKLRAKKPGIIQCPKCQAKVRVADSLFS